MEQSLWKRRLCFYFVKSYRRSVYVLFLKKSTKKPGNRSEWFPKGWLQGDAFRADPPCRRKGGRILLYEYPLVVWYETKEPKRQYCYG